MLYDEKPEPILVLNPETKRYVNIAPLFKTINENHDGNFHRASKAIDKVIRSYVCLKTEAMESDPLGFNSNCFELFNFRDALEGISEYKEERR
jgi:hypothetical protein